jgi:hypothetical protein
MTRRNGLLALALAVAALVPSTAAARPARLDTSFGAHGFAGPLTSSPASSAIAGGGYARGETVIGTERGTIVRLTAGGRLATRWADRGRAGLPLLWSQRGRLTLAPWPDGYGTEVLAYESWTGADYAQPQWPLPLQMASFDPSGRTTSTAPNLSVRLADPQIGEPAAHQFVRLGNGDVLDIAQTSARAYTYGGVPNGALDIWARRFSPDGSVRYVRRLLHASEGSPASASWLQQPAIGSGDGALIQLSNGGRLVVARVLGDGTLDPAFGDGGFARSPVSAGAPAPVAFLPWQGGAILVTPRWTMWVDAHGKVAAWRVVRADAAGVDSSGRLLLARTEDRFHRVSVIRLRTDRTLDRGFGVVSLRAPGKKGLAAPTQVVAQPGGRVVVVGASIAYDYVGIRDDFQSPVKQGVVAWRVFTR